KREESAAGRRLLQAHRSHQHHRVAHGDEHRTVGLTREFARLNGYGVITILKAFFDSAHLEPLCVIGIVWTQTSKIAACGGALSGVTLRVRPIACIFPAFSSHSIGEGSG